MRRAVRGTRRVVLDRAGKAAEDRGENLVVLPLDRFLSPLKSAGDPLAALLQELDDRQDLSDLLDELDSGADLNELLEDLGNQTDLDALLEELKADD